MYVHTPHTHASSRLNAASLLIGSVPGSCLLQMTLPSPELVKTATSPAKAHSRQYWHSASVLHSPAGQITPFKNIHLYAHKARQLSGSIAPAPPHSLTCTRTAGTHPAGGKTPTMEEQRLLQSTHQSCCTQAKGMIKIMFKRGERCQGLAFCFLTTFMLKKALQSLWVFSFFFLIRDYKK